MRRRAFTLIEATTVCAILAMLAALAFPNVVAMKTNRERKESYNAVLRLAQRARESAIREGRTYVLALEGNGTSVVLQRDEAKEKEQSSDPRIPAQGDESAREDVDTVALPDGVTLGDSTLGGQPSSAPDFLLHFYPDGRCDGGGFEMVEGSTKRNLSVAKDGLATLGEGELAPTTQDSWEAGQHEQRTSG